MNQKLIATIAPPAPPCFESRSLWVEYLASAQESAAGSGRTSNAKKPFTEGKYNASYPFCRDCNAKHAAEMTKVKRCDYEGYVEKVQQLQAAAAATTEGQHVD